jgi:hypothetical protein
MEPQTPLALPPEHKNNRKFIIIIASLFVLFTVSASMMFFVKDQLGYYPEVIQNQKNTNDNEWKTYRNDEYGFEFKYPKDYPSKDISNGVIILPTPENCQCDAPDGLKLYAYQSFDDFKKTKNSVLDLNMFMQENFWLFGSTTKNINAIEWTCGDQEGPGAVELCISQNSNGNIFLLYFNLQDSIKNQILSTFKFLNSTTTDISNWKTYRNEQYGFELKMPSDWVIKKYNDWATFRIQSTDVKNNLHGTGIPVTGNMWIDIFLSTCKDNNFQQISKFIPESVPDILTSYNCRGGIGIDMGLWQNDNDLKNHEDILEKIFSTFKFIK